MAEVIYKSTDSRGEVSYSDHPLPGAVKVERVPVEPVDPESAARIEAERERLRRQADEVQQRQRQRGHALEEADAEVIAAIDALKEAQVQREAGVEPLPGERLGDVGGRTRLGPSYVERQQALEREISAAQQRLEQAYARRNELR
jgi:hypothetical protein